MIATAVPARLLDSTARCGASFVTQAGYWYSSRRLECFLGGTIARDFKIFDYVVRFSNTFLNDLRIATTRAAYQQTRLFKAQRSTAPAFLFDPSGDIQPPWGSKTPISALSAYFPPPKYQPRGPKPAPIDRSCQVATAHIHPVLQKGFPR